MKDAGEREASLVLGVKGRQLFSKQSRFNWTHSSNMQPLVKHMQDQIAEQKKMRR